VEEALGIMARAYEKLGMNDLRDDTLRVIKLNFPNSPWLTGEGLKVERDWWKFW
jgi:outer membrane protein assembly factor BamD